MVPAPVTAMKDMCANDPKGIMTVHCMAQNENIKFYKEDKYWNADLKEEFNQETMGLWNTTHADKHVGRIFNPRGVVSENFESSMMKVDEEMKAAVAKHGEIQYPDGSHIDDFYDTIDKNKADIARA